MGLGETGDLRDDTGFALGVVGGRDIQWRSRANGDCFLACSLLGRLLGMVLYLEINLRFGYDLVVVGFLWVGLLEAGRDLIHVEWVVSGPGVKYGTQMFDRRGIHTLPLRGW